MGTRNLTMVMINNEYKIAQYGQWDGYPSGQGVTVLNFLRETNLDKFKDTLGNVSFITEDEWSDIIENYTDGGSVILGSENDKYWKENLTHLDRDIGAKVLEMVRDGEATKLNNRIGFAGNSLFCEYAYVIDFDKGTFEIYGGVNEEPIKEGRFISGVDYLEKIDGYEPVKLIQEYKLDDLPDNDEFLSDLEPREEYEV